MHIGLIGGIGPAATDYYYRRLIATFARAKVIPLLAVESCVPEVLSKSDLTVHKLKNGVETLFAVGDCVFCLVFGSRDFVEKYWRAWIALENRVEEEAAIFRSPNATPLVGRIQIKLPVPP